MLKKEMQTTDYVCPVCNNTGWFEETCGNCSGSGEGMYDGSTCPVCRGKSTQIVKCTDPDCKCYLNEDY